MADEELNNLEEPEEEDEEEESGSSAQDKINFARKQLQKQQAAGKAAQGGAKAAQGTAKAGKTIAATGEVIAAVFSNPYVLGGIAVVLIIGIIIVIMAFLPCLNGKCGRTATKATDVIKDRPNILRVLYYSADQEKRVTLILENAEDEKKIFEQIKKDNPNNAELQSAINNITSELDKLIETKASSSIVEQRKQAKIVDQLFAKFKQIYDFGTANLEDYIAFAKTKGSTLQKPPVYGLFNSPRDASPSTGRTTAGLHNGYDFPAPAGTPVIAGWDGTVGPSAPYNYEASSWALEVQSGLFIVIYGHINLNENYRKVGTSVKKGDQLGTVYNDHLDIKIKTSESAKRWIDWGGKTWRVRKSNAENENTATIDWQQ